MLSDDPTTPGGIEYKQVIQTFNHETNYLVDVYIGGEKITTTEGHPFWVKDVGWVAARELSAGSQLQTKGESWLGVERVEKHTEVATVYNFEVQGFHTYFVSDLGLLVHNGCPLSPKVEKILKDLEADNIQVKINPKNPQTAQEGNITLKMGEGINVNIRVETHPLEIGGAPIRHANVEVTRLTP